MDLKDYSGEFHPDRTYLDFDKHLIKDLYSVTADLFVMIDGCWVSRMRDRLGLEETTKISIEIWEYMLAQEGKRTAKVFNVRTGPEANVIDFLKLFQLTPGYGADKFPKKFDILNENYATVQFMSCASLLYYERKDLVRPGVLPGCCAPEFRCIRSLVDVVNPAIQFRAIKLPPRSGPKDMFCKWEFSLGAETQRESPQAAQSTA